MNDLDFKYFIDTTTCEGKKEIICIGINKWDNMCSQIPKYMDRYIITVVPTGAQGDQGTAGSEGPTGA